jgi:lipopolysaccharide biosynthesis glycosyltransferase
MNGRLNIVTATEDNYAPALGVALYSLLSNSKRRKDLKIYILTDFMSKENQKKFTGMFKQFAVDFEILYLEKDKYSGLKLSGYFHTPSVYYVLDIPNILSNVEKAVYFDCDFLIDRPIEEIFDTMLGDKYLAARPSFDGHEPSTKHKQRLGIEKEKNYFNAGFMLMDLKSMRKKRIAQKTYDFILNNPSKIVACDQDGLNYIVSGDFIPLDTYWNFPVKNSHLVSKENTEKTGKALHFLGRKKPWFFSTWVLYKLRIFENTRPYYLTYWKYLDQSPWKDTKFEIRKSDIELILDLIKNNRKILLNPPRLIKLISSRL